MEDGLAFLECFSPCPPRPPWLKLFGVLYAPNGNLNVARHPRPPPRFSSAIVPPCASAICRLRARPIPDPLGLVVKNGTNRFDVSERPLPSSSMFSSNQCPHSLPADRDAAAGFERRVDGVADDVDEQLLDLIGIGGQADVRRRRCTVTGRRFSSSTMRAARSRPREAAAAAASAGARAARRRGGTGRARRTVLRSATAPAAPRRRRSERGARDRRCRLSECAIDLIGVSELLISCDRTRTMRCHAACSSSRSAWLRSVMTTSWCGPAFAIELRRAAFRTGRGVRRTCDRSAAATRRTGTRRSRAPRPAARRLLVRTCRAAARRPC